MIEDAYIDVDSIDGPEGQPIVQAHLILEGDFVDKCSRYIESMGESKLVLMIPRDVAEKLRDSINEVL